MTGSVIVITGPPGSGKSTVAELVAERAERAVHIESDIFFRWIVSGRAEPWLSESHAQNVFVMGLVGDVAAAYARADYLTIIDGILAPDWFLQPVTDKVRSSGLDVTTVILRAPLEVCLERASSRPSRPLHDRAVVEQLWASFEDLSDVEAIVVETGELDATATAETVLAALGEGGSRMRPR
jgi:adenylate kinase family enzyme